MNTALALRTAWLRAIRLFKNARSREEIERIYVLESRRGAFLNGNAILLRRARDWALSSLPMNVRLPRLPQKVNRSGNIEYIEFVPQRRRPIPNSPRPLTITNAPRQSRAVANEPNQSFPLHAILNNNSQSRVNRLNKTNGTYQPTACINESETGLGSPAFQRCFTTAHRPQLRALAAASLGNSCKAASVGRLMAYQYTVSELARVIAHGGTQGNRNRGLVVWANTGSGKSISSLAILLQYFPLVNEYPCLAIVTTLSNLKSQHSFETYASALKQFFPHLVNMVLNTNLTSVGGRSATAGTVSERIVRQLRTRIMLMSYEQARNFMVGRDGANFQKYQAVKAKLQLPSAKFAFVVDEAQGMLQNKGRSVDRGPLPEFSEGEQFAKSITQAMLPKVHLYALSATPGTSVAGWLRMLSLVRPVGMPSFEPYASNLIKIMKTLLNNPSAPEHEQYKKMCANFRGLLVYADGRGDLNRHACVLAQRTIAARMDPFYYVSYLRKYSESTGKEKREMPEYALHKNIIQLANNKRQNIGGFLSNTARQQKIAHVQKKEEGDDYMKLMRAAGNFLPITSCAWWPDTVMQRARAEGRVVPMDRGEKIASHKLLKVIKVLNSSLLKGKHFLYTIGNGAGAETDAVLARMLEMRGWVNVTEAVKRGMSSSGSILGLPKDGTKRFVILKNNYSAAEITAIKSAFNGHVVGDKGAPDRNKNGDIIRLIIGTGGFFEGFDSKNLRYVHILEPMATDFADLQVAGRGVRNCAHQDLEDKKDRTVVIFRYHSMPPPEVSSRMSKESWNALLQAFLREAKRNRPMNGLNKGNKTKEKLTKEFEKAVGGWDMLSLLGSRIKYIKSGSLDQYLYTSVMRNPARMMRMNFERALQAMAVDCNLLKGMHKLQECGRVPRVSAKLESSVGEPCKLRKK